MKLLVIVGVRPQFIKLAMAFRAFKEYCSSEVDLVLVHTGQHYDDNMSGVFFRELGLPEPDYSLEAGGGNAAEQVQRIKERLHNVLEWERPDAVVVFGDTNSTVAGALATADVGIPLIHIEAGDRAGLKDNPEEQNRIAIDKTSSLLLCSSEQAVRNLAEEGIINDVYFVGNLMEDSFLHNINRSWQRNVIDLLNHAMVAVPKEFYYLTCHRQENANDRNLTEILSAMNMLPCPTIYPVHPRNKDRVRRIIDRSGGFSNIIFTEPAGYFDSIHLTNEAQSVVTDSGGVLQEAHFAQTPYVFVLEVDHVPKTTRFDVSRLAKPERGDIVKKVMTKQQFRGCSRADGKVAERIARFISYWKL